MFKEYYNPLCNFAHQILKDSRAAEDVVQDVFANVWEKKSNLTIDQNTAGYLFRSVKNKALEKIRRDKVIKDLADVSWLSKDTDIEVIANDYILKEKLSRSIELLPPKCKKIFEMNKYEGLTYREIAEKLDISIKTVEAHMGNAFRKLRKMMTKEKIK